MESSPLPVPPVSTRAIRYSITRQTVGVGRRASPITKLVTNLGGGWVLNWTPRHAAKLAPVFARDDGNLPAALCSSVLQEPSPNSLSQAWGDADH